MNSTSPFIQRIATHPIQNGISVGVATGTIAALASYLYRKTTSDPGSNALSLNLRSVLQNHDSAMSQTILLAKIFFQIFVLAPTGENSSFGDAYIP